ncbi:MAG: bifunctional DNA primase/polymerase, partial [Phototrophicales bacterium]|nr:bifunctional DNA primase/polymerase [Phototrophicales bacterium]
MRANTFESAIYYLNQHWSIFPVFADSRTEFAKHPALRWQIYQTRPATHTELTAWYGTQNHMGIAIVTGNLSRLVVLDFDSPHLYDTFCAQHPHLAQSYTVNTKRGKHIYYSLIPTLHAPPTTHGTGVDFQSEGAYVVAPPTTINGFTYTVAKDLPTHKLIPADMALIRTFIQSSRAHAPKISRQTEKTPLSPTMTIDRLQQLYLESIQMGRNNALFWVSCLARDYGISQTHLTNQLATIHASRPTPTHHHHETHATRVKEACATIASAYSRPARPIKPYNPLTPQLPNRLREAMLQ